MTIEYLLDKANEFYILAGHYPVRGKKTWNARTTQIGRAIRLPGARTYQRAFRNIKLAWQLAAEKAQAELDKHYEVSYAEQAQEELCLRS